MGLGIIWGPKKIEIARIATFVAIWTEVHLCYFLDIFWLRGITWQRRRRGVGREEKLTQPIFVITRPTPTATPPAVISDWGRNLVALSVTNLTPSVALGQPITKLTLAVLVGKLLFGGCERVKSLMMPTSERPECSRETLQQGFMPKKCAQKIRKAKNTLRFFFIHVLLQMSLFWEASFWQTKNLRNAQEDLEKCA